MASRFLRQFTIQTETGERVLVEEWQAMIDNSPGPPIPGLKQIQTRDGHHVNRISETEFEIIGWGMLAENVNARLGT